MSEYRENLLDRMIHLYGFENELVIQFAKMAEKYPDNAGWDKALRVIVESHEECPVVAEE